MKKIFLIILSFTVITFLFYDFTKCNSQTVPGFPISSLGDVYGPRNVSNVYDWHNRLDFGTGTAHRIVKTLEKGEIILSGDNWNKITISNWKYVHCYRNNGSNSPLDEPILIQADGDSKYKLFCGYLNLKYVNSGNEVETKSVLCSMIWEDNKLTKIYASDKNVYYEDGSEKIYAQSTIEKDAIFALTSGFGPSGNNSYGFHLHLERTDIKNPLLFIDHPYSATPEYTINIIQPGKDAKIKDEPNKKIIFKFNVDFVKGKDLDKSDLFLYSVLKDNPSNDDQIFYFDYAGRIGNPKSNCHPNGTLGLYPEPKTNNSARGNESKTGVSPIGTGPGNHDFFYVDLKTKTSEDVLTTKYPDGEYKYHVRVYNVANKSKDSEVRTIVLNNWTPQIKSLTTNATPDKPLKAGDTIEIKIEFTEQMDTGKTPAMQIWDTKASQWKSLSLSGTAWSNSTDGRIKDALLKASATLPELGETDEGTTQELKVKVREAKGKGGDDDVIKQEHLGKDANGANC